MSCDYAVKYEEEKYGVQHPVAIVSWPTLDPVEHDSEWNEYGKKSLEYNDKVSVDINNINTKSSLRAGFFGAYHIYPNYPDFMNNEEKYAEYLDGEGVLRYGGYLREFMENHRKYPALVGEFGLATGAGNAHYNPDGYHHGGMTEEEQGKGIVRMMKAIKREGYAGGLIFEWMDEWAKKTWMTEPFMIPYERHVLWHNVMDPEQNYGLLAYECRRGPKYGYSQNGKGLIKKLSLGYDCEYLYIDIFLQDKIDFSSQKLVIGLDTFDRNRGEFGGEFVVPRVKEVIPFGLEFVVEISGEEESRILVNPGYNIAKGKYSPSTTGDGIFKEIHFLTNKERVTKDGRKIDAIYHNMSRLNYGTFEKNTKNHWYIEENKIRMRLPWALINVTDPSSHTVLDDSRDIPQPGRDELNTAKSDGIMVCTYLVDKKDFTVKDALVTNKPYLWEGWENVEYTSRLKSSYYIIKEYFSTL